MGERIVAAMSGGVDSSVAAALLAKAGHEVIGVTLRTQSCEEEKDGRPGALAGSTLGRRSWHGQLRRPRCCAASDVSDARRVAEKLGIRHYVLDVRAKFRSAVIEPFLAAYASGLTPNPCAACNHALKFGLLLDKARALGAQALATGHYARIADRAGRPALLRAADQRRDQSYFLYGIPADRLPWIRFPLGEMTKDSVRKIARRLGLAIADKPDSQEICFVTDGDTRGFLSRAIKARPGSIVDAKGRVLGRHPGVHLFTIGQRRGLGLGNTGKRQPFHVVALDARRRRVVVGPAGDLAASGCVVGKVNRLSPDWPAAPVVKIRSQHPGVVCRVRRLADGRLAVRFARPQRSVTPSQSAVFYEGDEVLGGGVIIDQRIKRASK
jgi:tRNA-specific 2-thiouridylase